MSEGASFRPPPSRSSLIFSVILNISDATETKELLISLQREFPLFGLTIDLAN